MQAHLPLQIDVLDVQGSLGLWYLQNLALTTCEPAYASIVGEFLPLGPGNLVYLSDKRFSEWTPRI